MGQITPAQLQALLGYASKQLGVSPEQLMRVVQSGNLSNVTDGDTARKINELAGDPARIQELLNSPQAKELLERFQGG